MGVNIFILDRRPVRLSVAGVVQDVGSLRRFWKMTELDDERAAEMTASGKAASALPSPKAAMLADVSELPSGSADGTPVKAHLVIGWDEGRTRVTDFVWDSLPVLGYAVHDPDAQVFVLHEERDQTLHPLGRGRAVDLGLTGTDGLLLPHGQPTITGCRLVQPAISGYAEAVCVLDDGREQTLLVGITDGVLPAPEWFVGRKPMETERYPSGRAVSGASPKK